MERNAEGVSLAAVSRISPMPLSSSRLNAAQRQQVLAEWNNTAAEFPKDKCVHQLFEEQVARTPDALAVADGKTQLTYSELNVRAERVAKILRELGIAPDARVGVCVERSVEMVVGILAVCKSGGAYVPFDPASPRERLSFMLSDASISVLLTDKPLCEKFDFEFPNLKVICMEELMHEKLDEVFANAPTNQPQSTNLAYVIYTSGSTGQPKGVEIEHRSLVNLIAWHQRTYNVTPQDRASQIAAPAFDASVWEIWPHLTCGASLHICDDETRLSPQKLIQWFAEKQITLAFVPTPIAETTFDEAWPQNISLRAMLTGGDKLHRPPPLNFPCKLFNHYGPTENTVVTSWNLVPPDDTKMSSPTIGRPIANTQVYVLDENLAPAPIGEAGELHIGGIGLARDYLNRAELTAEK
ncbi:MAG TPA: amino acid adenylation domain-containing protein, partial [Candidatus Baltobacteraceae bacterium]|nr:amino acid adenylation domain-containing protein [Candidatus Baltobacteraceae bacterium]